MSDRITVFSDGSYLKYNRENAEDRCIYLSRPDGTQYAPGYDENLEQLTKYTSKYGKDIIYNDFVSVYNMTSKQIIPSTLEYIKQLTLKYREDALEIAILFTILYLDMVAEESKEQSKLGKRMKRLGVYQTIYDNIAPEETLRYATEESWQEIDKICKDKGF